MAMASKSFSPLETAVKMAVRSAQLDRPKLAFSTLVPRKTRPSATTGELRAIMPGKAVDHARSRGGATSTGVNELPSGSRRNMGQSSTGRLVIWVEEERVKLTDSEIPDPSSKPP